MRKQKSRLHFLPITSEICKLKYTLSYCNQIYLQNTSSTSPGKTATATSMDHSSDTPSIYHTLLALYLSPPPPHQPNLAPALDLLSRHGARLPASQTLDLIPSTIPVADLESYFRGRIRNAVSGLRLGAIEGRLWGVERARVEASLLLGEKGAAGLPEVGGGGRNRRVLIGEERHCAVCHKRFGNSAIRVYPDNTVVHYGCFPRGAKGAGGGAGLDRRGW
jgi:Vam6/Vps39-like protein vacuolar protein sorting-associated protein 39